MKKIKIALGALAIGVLLAPTAVNADEKGTATLKKASTYIGQVQSMRFETEIAFNGSINGNPEGLVTDYAVTVSRPDTVSVTLNNRELTMEFYSDGTSTTRFLPDYDQFVEEAIPTSPAMALRNSSFAVIDPAVQLLSELLMANPFEMVSDALYVGSEKIGDTAVDRIKFDYNGIAAELWIEQGDAPRVLKMQPDMTTVGKQMVAGNPNINTVKLEVVADIKDWIIGGDLDALLAFNPPEAAKKVAQFDLQPPPPAYALLGKPAPSFKLDVMEGGSLDIAAKQDDEILILDFWATWCGPCRKAMPILEKVSEEFADQGVKLYAVNLEEEAEDIKEFLGSQNLDVMVALDSDSSVAAQYMVQGIPQTVIIGRDGTVQVVHVGVSPQLESQIRDELSTLVKGERLTD